ncbi:MAG: hypothetical protein RIE86_09320 [Imperialibacter sp.]|uniref:hypothetical protein n=1 Tax=Imperialibacter sp. TaxID=2038411 RepID=UPI0032ED4C6E
MEERLTGRYTFKRTWFGLVLWVQVAHVSPGEDSFATFTWRKGTEFDLLELDKK